MHSSSPRGNWNSMAQLNAAFYAFASLSELPPLRERWLSALKLLGVKGTIILAPEGINGFLAGSEKPLREALDLIRSQPGLSEMRVKESTSRAIPFRKLCIKLKKEIVTFRVPEFSPPARTAARIQPAELAKWYSEGRDFIALDTRNAFEAHIGTFENAITLPIDNFVDLAEEAKRLPDSWKTKPIVTFCTGGIRCEKAAPYLASLGFEKVLQLEGGILGYFEAVGGKHWNGECFVFDDRIALGPDLLPTGASLCPRCQWPISGESQACTHCVSIEESR